MHQVAVLHQVIVEQNAEASHLLFVPRGIIDVVLDAGTAEERGSIYSTFFGARRRRTPRG